MSPAVPDGLENRATGFAPVAGAHARVLVLGSLPSRMSLETGQYYGNPRNAFWRIAGDLFDAGPEVPYAARTARLVQQRVAIWDVLYSSIRPGSLDADIETSSAKPNDFRTFLAAQPQLRALCFNGRKAAQLFGRLVVARGVVTIDELQCITLPSTSPAHAALSYDDKLRQWSVIREIAGSNRRP